MLLIRYVLALGLVLTCQFASAGAYEDMLDAVKRDDTSRMSALFKRGFDANTTDQEGNTLLMLAAKVGSAKAVKQLVKTRAKVNARNALGESALMLAALQGHLEIVRDLVSDGAEVNSTG